MITQAAVEICKDQVEQVQRTCVCVYAVRCIYNTRFSLATEVFYFSVVLP